MARDFLTEFPRLFRDPFLDRGRQVLVREVDRRLEMREHAREALRPAPVERALRARELARRLPALRLGFGRHQVGDRLGLEEVELAVQERAAGEFAGLGEAQPFMPQDLEERGEHGAAAVHLELGHVLAGRAPRPRKPEHDAVVEEFARLRVLEPRVPRVPRRRQMPGEARQGARRPRPRQSHHRYRGTAGGRRRREDRFVRGRKLGRSHGEPLTQITVLVLNWPPTDRWEP